ncbi:MAG: SAM-dependent methyltransferase [Myxococcales bacterium]|nr:SAM-dependent methyltransferase [Myxococcales bacterium]
MAETAPAIPDRLRRSRHLSTFAHLGAVYLYHDLFGFLMEMSPDVLAVVDAFGDGAAVADVVARFDGAFEGASPRQFVEIFAQHFCLIEEDDDEVSGLWPMVAIKGKWNVWRRHGDRVTLWTAWGDAPVQRIELDEAETRLWDAIDGEKRLAELRKDHDAALIQRLVPRLTHSDVQALKLCMFPMSTFAKRPQMAPAYLASTMPYPRWSPGNGAPGVATPREVSPTEYYRRDVHDADAQFDHQETTLSHLLRLPHPALAGRTYGQALVDALVARGAVAAAGGDAPLRVLEIGGGLGFVAEAVCGALAARGHQVAYTIVELAPALAAAQRQRLAGHPVTWVEGDALAVELAAGGFDLIVANEMIGDLPALTLHRADVGLETEGGGEVDPAKVAALGRAGELVEQLGLRLDDATEPFYLLTGAFELVQKVAGWLAPGGTAVITEFGDLGRWPRLSTHLDHPELSIHFGQLHQAAIAAGLAADIVFVIDLIDIDRGAQGLATTRSHFRALRAMLADAGVDLDKIGYTPAMLDATLGDKVAASDVGELRWDRIEDRLMGLVPHEFLALVARRPAPGDDGDRGN